MVRFALSNSGISVAVIGMKPMAEVAENLQAAEGAGLDAEIIERMKMLVITRLCQRELLQSLLEAGQRLR